jgi:HPt (histidine-containing phosphotransfer) domain-containing protein
MLKRTIASALPEGLSREQIQRYARRREQDLLAIGSAIASKDAAPIREIAHKIKGNAALYGLEEFGLAAARLLADSEADDWNAMERSAKEMAEELRLGLERLV